MKKLITVFILALFSVNILAQCSCSTKPKTFFSQSGQISSIKLTTHLYEDKKDSVLYSVYVDEKKRYFIIKRDKKDIPYKAYIKLQK